MLYLSFSRSNFRFFSHRSFSTRVWLRLRVSANPRYFWQKRSKERLTDMASVLTPALHRRNVRTLYKAVLRLHRGLPEDLKTLGDKYVRDEFKRHKDATAPEHVQRFMIEWTDYAMTLSKQLSSRSLVRSVPLGRPLTPDKLDAFSDEQIFQLNELRIESENLKPSSGTK